MPAVGIIPLGTGNDLARSLGWGPALTETAQLSEYVRRAQLAEVKEVDQWKLTLQVLFNMRFFLKSIDIYNKFIEIHLKSYLNSYLK